MWAYCYPVIILDVLLLLWRRAIKQSKQTAIVQMLLQMSRSTFWEKQERGKHSFSDTFFILFSLKKIALF